MTDIRQVLAANIKRFRGELGLSQIKFAEKANISTNYLAMIELKHKFPTPEMLEQLAQALNVDVLELFSVPPTAGKSLKNLRRQILEELKTSVICNVETALEQTVSEIINMHLDRLPVEAD